MLTPMEIHNKEFKKSFRGYAEDEVDEFLDRVVADYEKLVRDNDSLTNQLTSAHKELDQYRRLERDLQDTISIAQKTAEEVTTAAKQRADALRENTDQECKNIRRRAELEAKRILDSAAIEIKQKMTEAEAKLRDMRSEYETITRDKTQLLMKIRASFETELSILNQNLNDIPKIGENDPMFTMQSQEISPEEQTEEVESQPEEVSEDESTPVIPVLFEKKKGKSRRSKV